MIPAMGRDPLSGAEASPSPGHGTILVVDESLPVRQKIVEVLEKLGTSAASILQATTAEEALAAFRTSKPSLVLAEFIGVHPEDGLEIIHEMLEADPRARIVLVTAEPRESPEVRAAIRAGAFAFVEKPVRYEKIRAVLADLEAEEGGIERLR